MIDIHDDLYYNCGCDNSSVDCLSDCLARLQDSLRQHDTQAHRYDWISELLTINTTNKVILTTLFSAIFVLAVSGNLLVLVTVAVNRSMWTSMHLFIVSLSLSDVIIALTCIPLDMCRVLVTDWILGTSVCKMQAFVQQVFLHANALTLCCMAGERYLAIVFPLKFTAFHTVERALCALAVVWLVSLGAAGPLVMFYETVELCGDVTARSVSGELCREEFTHTMCRTKPEYLELNRHYNWVTFILLYVVPVVILGVAYSIITYRLWVKTPVGQVVVSDVGHRTRYKRRVIQMLLLVMALFIVCWTPLLTFNLVANEVRRLKASDDLLTIRHYLQCLALSGTAYNPIIYAFLNHKFRTHFLSFLASRRRNKVAPCLLPADKPDHHRKPLEPEPEPETQTPTMRSPKTAAAAAATPLNTLSIEVAGIAITDDDLISNTSSSTAMKPRSKFNYCCPGLAPLSLRFWQHFANNPADLRIQDKNSPTTSMPTMTSHVTSSHAMQESRTVATHSVKSVQLVARVEEMTTTQC